MDENPSQPKLVIDYATPAMTASWGTKVLRQFARPELAGAFVIAAFLVGLVLGIRLGDPGELMVLPVYVGSIWYVVSRVASESAPTTSMKRVRGCRISIALLVAVIAPWVCAGHVVESAPIVTLYERGWDTKWVTRLEKQLTVSLLVLLGLYLTLDLAQLIGRAIARRKRLSHRLPFAKGG